MTAPFTAARVREIAEERAKKMTWGKDGICPTELESFGAQLLSEFAESVARECERVGDRAYCDAIQSAQRTVCLGWEAKAKNGSFGAAEYEAHEKLHKLIGQHVGHHEAARFLRAAAKRVTE